VAGLAGAGKNSLAGVCAVLEHLLHNLAMDEAIPLGISSKTAMCPDMGQDLQN